ncbi:MAG: hypothetical protein ISS55_04065 [Dehalococcoidales bacterium]|nr:hypothetical protein [Dehalococcoidales bacterium]
MNKSWMPTAAGVLNIISAAIRLLVVLCLIIAMIVTGDFLIFTGLGFWFPLNVMAVLWLITVPLAVTGVLALIGGIFALQRKRWGLALAGSIAAFLPFGILGLVATIFTSLSRDDFEEQEAWG